MRRLVAAAAVMAVAGCQCFEPVAQGHGEDAGVIVDAGVDAGIDGGCGFYGDCFPLGDRSSVAFCTGGVEGGSSSWSCLDHHCLWECTGGRTCTSDGGCIACQDGTVACPSLGCASLASQCTARVEQSTCAAMQVGALLELDALGTCAYRVATCGGTPAQLGTVTELSPLGIDAVIPSLGGHCTGEFATTNALRVILNCPDCQVVIGF